MPTTAGRLLPGEQALLEAGRHPIALVRHSLLPAGLVLAGLVLWAITPDGTGVAAALSTGVAFVRWALLLGGAAWIAWNVLDWRAARWVVTSVRVLGREGVLGRRTSEAALGTIAEVRVRSTLAGRRLGFGDVVLATRGDGPLAFGCVRDPAELRDAILAARSGELLGTRGGSGVAAGSGAGPLAAGPAGMVPPTSTVPPAGRAIAPGPGRPAVPRGASAEQARRLVALAELRDRGLLTEAEFQAKKAEILARM